MKHFSENLFYPKLFGILDLIKKSGLRCQFWPIDGRIIESAETAHFKILEKEIFLNKFILSKVAWHTGFSLKSGLRFQFRPIDGRIIESAEMAHLKIS